VATRTREKAIAREEFADNRPRALARYIRISSRKVGAVIDLIRGKKVDAALAILAGTVRSSVLPVEKLLKSAIANAENNLNLDREDLYIAEIYASQGPTLKRFSPRAKGSASRILKRTSHITVILDQVKR